MIHLFLLLLILFNPCAFALDEAKVPVPLTSDSLKILNVSLSQDKNRSRLIIELNKPVEKAPPFMAVLQTVTFDLNAEYSAEKHGGEDKILEILSENQEDFITNIALRKNDSNINFEIKRKYFSPVTFKKQNDPPALIVELERNYFLKESSIIKPGVIKHTIRSEIERGPVVANAIELDLDNKNISFKVALPDRKKIKGKETLSNLVKSEMAFAGINANFFDVKAGNPLGALITDGSWVTGPIYNRPAIGFNEKNKPFVDKVMLVGKVNVYRGFRKKLVSMFEIDGLNTPFGLYNRVGYFTKDFDEIFTIPKHKEAVLVVKGCIKKIKGDSLEIPEDGYALLVSDIYHFNKIKRKDCLSINWVSDPDWSHITEAVSGGPYLIKHGDVFIDLEEEKFKFTQKDTFAPRSAIGIGKNGKLFLVTVDGRRNGYSVGVTFEELAKILKNLDIKEAINLDGGGSSTLVLDNEIINSLSEHHERKISNALLVFYKQDN